MLDENLEKCHFLPGGGSRKLGGGGGDQLLFLDQKVGSKDFLKSKRGDHLYFLKETKYFVKHFRFQRKGLSDATRG